MCHSVYTISDDSVCCGIGYRSIMLWVKLTAFLWSTFFQTTSNGEPSNHVNGSQLFAERSELWKPLNCLVEAANRTKSLKSGPQSPNIKDEQLNGHDTDGHIHRPKVREYSQKSKVQDGKNGSVFTPAATFKAKRAQGISRKRRERGASAHSLLGAAAAHGQRRFNPIWFSLIASFDQ